MNHYHFTNRLDRIFSIAKSILSVNEVIQPVHLFIGACKEGSSICNELFSYLRLELGDEFIDQVSSFSLKSIDEMIRVNDNNVSIQTHEIIKKAQQKTKRFGQNYLNEGHLLSALLENDTNIISFLGSDRIKEILNLVATPRDLTVNLTNYTLPMKLSAKITVRKVIKEDFQKLKSFVEAEFGHKWIDAIQNGFASNDIPIYIALINESIVGFACYDVVRNRKGLFGPMGTSSKIRCKGVGFNLLHSCLNEMKSIGYEYAIIGQAGPIEFYEKSCHAKLIP